MIQLTDTDKMPWGHHIGTLMQDVPVSYLHFIWTKHGKKHDKSCAVANYIRENMSALQDENDDLIW